MPASPDRDQYMPGLSPSSTKTITITSQAGNMPAASLPQSLSVFFWCNFFGIWIWVIFYILWVTHLCFCKYLVEMSKYVECQEMKYQNCNPSDDNILPVTSLSKYPPQVTLGCDLRCSCVKSKCNNIRHPSTCTLRQSDRHLPTVWCLMAKLIANANLIETKFNIQQILPILPVDKRFVGSRTRSLGLTAD